MTELNRLIVASVAKSFNLDHSNNLQLEEWGLRLNTGNRMFLVSGGKYPMLVKVSGPASASRRRLQAEADWCSHMNTSWPTNVLVSSRTVVAVPRAHGTVELGVGLAFLREYVPNTSELQGMVITGHISEWRFAESLEDIFRALRWRVRKGQADGSVVERLICERVSHRLGELRRIDGGYEFLCEKRLTAGLRLSLLDVASAIPELAASVFARGPALIGDAHGDLTLENILHASTGSSVWLIDGNAVFIKDPIYDLGKLFQCTYCRYSSIRESTSNDALDFNLYRSDILTNALCHAIRSAVGPAGISEAITQGKLMAIVHTLCLLPHHWYPGGRTHEYRDAILSAFRSDFDCG